MNAIKNSSILRKIFILGLLLSMLSCKKEEEVPMISFKLQVQGYDFLPAYAGSSEEFSLFEHHLSGGEFVCEGADKSYSFSFANDSLEHTLYVVPAGDYRISIRTDRASLYGQAWGTFQTSERDIKISRQTTEIAIDIEPDCAVFLVKDAFNHLDQGVYMIERHSYAHGFFTSYPLAKDPSTGLYYTYFTPDTVKDDPSAFLWFFEGEPGEEEGGLSTASLVTGARYDIEILQ